VAQLILDVLRDYVATSGEAPAAAPLDMTASTPIWGPGAVLDSAGLVSVVLEIESRVRETYGIDVTLADEHAFSQKRSPFRTVQTLAEYTCELAARNDEAALGQ
jgi:acyl carrier protein